MSEPKAVAAQTRQPTVKSRVMDLDLENSHYVVVEEHAGLPAMLDEYVNKLSPTDPGKFMYVDLGFQAGHCSRSNQHLLQCSKKDYEFLMNNYTQSANSRRRESDLKEEPQARQTFDELGAGMQEDDI